MVTVSIAAILTMLAAPSMIKSFRANRAQSESYALVGDLQFARSEAIRLGLPVTVCPSSDGSTCLGSAAWQTGWIVFVDPLGNVNSPSVQGTQALRVSPALRGGDTAALAPAPTSDAVVFNREGFTTGLGSGAVVFTFHTPDLLATATRCVNVDLGGRVTMFTSGQTTGQGTCR